VEKSGPVASQSFTVAGHADVLAGKSSAQNIDSWDTLGAAGADAVCITAGEAVTPPHPRSVGLRFPVCSALNRSMPVSTMNSFHVLVAGDVRPVPGEDFAGVRGDLALPHDAVADLLQAEVEAADTGEQRPDVHG
jgi:hypothetical protein